MIVLGVKRLLLSPSCPLRDGFTGKTSLPERRSTVEEVSHERYLSTKRVPVEKGKAHRVYVVDCHRPHVSGYCPVETPDAYEVSRVIPND